MDIESNHDHSFYRQDYPVKLKTIYVTFSNRIVVILIHQLVPNRTVVEITYIDPASCNIHDAPILGCMYDSSYNSSTMSWVYTNSCGLALGY